METNDPDRVRRFFEKVDKQGPIPQKCPHLGNCHIFSGAKDKKGYGNFTVSNGKVGKAHRFAFKLAFGWINGHPFQVHHKCDNPSCVNPKHLILLHGTKNNELSTSPSAINARKTHCKKGHLYSEENTRYERGRRLCVTCEAEKGRDVRGLVLY